MNWFKKNVSNLLIVALSATVGGLYGGYQQQHDRTVAVEKKAVELEASVAMLTKALSQYGDGMEDLLQVMEKIRPKLDQIVDTKLEEKLVALNLKCADPNPSENPAPAPAL